MKCNCNHTRAIVAPFIALLSCILFVTKPAFSVWADISVQMNMEHVNTTSLDSSTRYSSYLNALKGAFPNEDIDSMRVSLEWRNRNAGSFIEFEQRWRGLTVLGGGGWMAVTEKDSCTAAGIFFHECTNLGNESYLASKDNQDSPQVVTASILGALTIFLPCATTQAVEVLALTAGDTWYSALMLFFFTLGTAPTFLIFGSLINKGQASFQKYFPKILGIFLLTMSIYTTNSGVALTGSVYTIQNFYNTATKKNMQNETSILGSSAQTTTINVNNYGYNPKNITLKKGIPVKLNLVTTNVESCSRSFTIPSLNIQRLLPKSGTTTIEFTPTKLGLLAFSCSMGMYTGNFNVVN